MRMDRRSFLAGSIAASAVAVAGMTEAARASAPRWKTAVGLNGFMSSADAYKKNYPIWEILDFAAREGFDGIELVEGWPMGGYPPSDATDRVAALKNLYDRYGLRIHSIQTSGADAYAADAAVRKAWLRQFAEQIRLARALGCAFVGNWPGGDLRGHPDVDHAIEALVDSYREAAKIAADAGLFFSFEIEPPFVFNTLDHLRRIVTGVDHPACKTNYDPSHFDYMSGGHGKPEEMLRQLGVQYIGHVHLTDTDGTLYRGTSKHLACGDGHCDLRASLKTLWDGGYSGWIMIDAWMIEDVYRAAHQGKAAIDSAQKAFTQTTGSYAGARNGTT